MWCDVDYVYGEHMDREWFRAVKLVMEVGGNCSTVVKFLDDESGDDCLPLPGSSVSELPPAGKLCGDTRRGNRRQRRSRARGAMLVR